MKTAVCLSGQPRSAALVWPSLKTNLLDLLGEYDLFVHTSAPYPESFLEVLRPKVYIVEAQFPLTEMEDALRSVYFADCHLASFVQQVHGYFRLWQAKKNYELFTGQKYDLAVRTRPDLEFIRPVTQNLFDLSAVNLFPREADRARIQCPTDVFVLGPDSLMDAYFNLAPWIVTEGRGKLTRGDPWTSRLPPENVADLAGRHCPETILAAYLNDHAGVQTAYAACCLEDVLRVRR